ncbi:hypothetical protein HY524_02210 [Candidatus Berkelbacteria bacterium]|nr:hypothetical protein [Candidatus Berkelbacteria bacterium]
MVVLAVSVSPNYLLNDLNFNSGGADTGSLNYSARQSVGEVSGSLEVGSTYQSGTGLIFAHQAGVPPVPTFVNEANSYNKLKLTIDPTGNQTNGATFAVAVSTDGFTTTNYVQNDGTIGSTLGTEDWLTYAQWGGASGSFVTGLAASTTYTVKVTARHSSVSQSAYSLTANATTASGPSLSFDLDVSATDSETAAPYSLSLGTLVPGTVTTATERIWIDLSSNATNGASVYVLSANAGLRSTAENSTIQSTSGDLSVLSEGVGLQSTSATQASGGPLTAASGFDGSGSTVGAVSGTLQTLYRSSQPITNGRASLLYKAKVSRVALEATDYSDTLTLVAAGSF